MRQKLLFLLPILVLSLLLVPACDDENDNDVASTDGTFTPFSFQGAVAGANGEAGVLVVQVGPQPARSVADAMVSAATQNASGTYTSVNGDLHNLTGNYETSNGSFSLSGDGYSFTGSFQDGQATGSFTGPIGNGRFACLEGSTVTVYCGTYDGDSFGSWLLELSSTQVLGVFSDDSGAGGTLEGSVAGGNVTLTVPGSSVTASGTVDGTTISGNWDDGDGGTGTWSGSTGGCID